MATLVWRELRLAPWFLVILSLPSFLQLEEDPFSLRPVPSQEHLHSKKGGIPLIRPPNPLQTPLAMQEGLWEGVELVNAAGLPRSPDDDLYPPGSSSAPCMLPSPPPLMQGKGEHGSTGWKGKGKENQEMVGRNAARFDEKEFLRGLNFLRAGEVQEAESQFMTMLSQDPQSDLLMTVLGILAILQDRHEDGRKMFQKAINGNPDNDLALDCMTNWLEVFSGNVSEISNLCETALTNRPQNPDVLFAQATSLQTVFQDYDRACELLQSSLALAPSSHQMYLAYSVNCMRREQYEDAERSLRAAARLAPSDPFVEICRSKLHYKKYKDVKESLTLALRSLSLDPTNLLLVNIVAGQCVELGEYQQAKNLVKEAVWLDPSDELTVETFAHVALSNWEEEKREDCFKFLYEVVRDDPTNPRKLIAYSKFLEKHLPGLAVEDREPLMEEAGTWLYELLQERRSDAYFLYHYASFLVGPLYDLEESPGKHMLDSRRAGEMYRCAIALCPQHGEYHFGYAKYLHEITRDYEQSQKEYLTALKFDPNNGLYHLRYAMLLHHHMRDLRRAEEEYVIHLRQCPLDVLALVNYGILLCNGLERFSSAKRILQRAVQLSPDNTDAQLYLNFSIAMENDIPALPESRRKEDAAG